MALEEASLVSASVRSRRPMLLLALAAGVPAVHASAAHGQDAGNADVSGVLIAEDEPPASTDLLLVPRLAVAGAAIPVRVGLELYERHHLRARVVDILFDDRRIFGLYPALGYESGFGPSLGARFVHRDIDGRGGRLRLGADYGGEPYQGVNGSLRVTPLAALPLRVHLSASYRRQPRSRFFGVGNASDAPLTFFRQQSGLVAAGAELALPASLSVAVHSAYLDRQFRDAVTEAQHERLTSRFDTATLPGWNGGSRLVYSELQLTRDTLGVASAFIPAAAPSHGNKVVLFAGAARGLQDDAGTHLRWGGDVFQYFDLYNGDRVLLLRAHLEGVSGQQRHIAFTDLPQLGGPELLRGYDRGRFRDRTAMLAAIEYRYPIWRQLGGFLFLDAGRVLPGAGDLPTSFLSPTGFHPTGGFGLQAVNGERFQLRAQAAGSAEGVFFQVALEPVHGAGGLPRRIRS